MMPSPTTSENSTLLLASSAHCASADTHTSQVKSLYLKGHHQEALHHASFALRSFPQDAELWNAGALAAYALGLNADAESFWKTAIAHDGELTEAHYNLGVLYLESSQPDPAALHFARAIQLDPRHAYALTNLAHILNKRGSLAQAMELLKRALEADPTLPQAYRLIESVASRLNRIEELRGCMDQALQAAPNCAHALQLRAKTNFMMGDTAAGERDMDAALAADPENAAANLFRVEQGSHRADVRWTRALRRAFKKRGARCVDDRIALDFAMGKFAERRREYDLAFEAYAEGNRLHYNLNPFDDEAAEQSVTTAPDLIQPDMYTQAARLSRDAVQDSTERRPIFIIGMPRSGTTLLEQILASHPEVFGAGELTTLGELVNSAQTESALADGRRAWLEHLRTKGDQYLSAVWTSEIRARFVVDKMPDNYRYAGWIPLLMPRAKIIHIRRDPRDTCFSCFATKFADGHHYSFDLLALARHYDRYRRWMARWRAVLPAASLLEIDYEALVSDLEGVTRSVLAHAGLKWHDACADFHRNRRAVQTASFAQVTQPLYRSSIGRWRRFERHLSPLLEALSPHLRGEE